MTTTAQYGHWQSPLSAANVAEVKGAQKAIKVDDGHVYFAEYQPLQKGKIQICSIAVSDIGDGNLSAEAFQKARKEHLPEGYSAHSMVHEYGGAPYCVHNGNIYFVNAQDQQIYRATHQLVSAVTRAKGTRFADLQWDAKHGRLIAVAEIHSDASLPENQLVAIDMDGTITTLHSGYDFYMSPRLSNHGENLAFIAWNFPNMPWDETKLYVGENLAKPDSEHFHVFVEQAKHAPQQPHWHDDGSLYYLDDNETGFWQLYRASVEDLAEQRKPIEPLFAVDGEIGMPPWQFGFSYYTVFADGSVCFVACQNGQDKLGLWSENAHEIHWIDDDAVNWDTLVLGERGDVAYCFSAFADAESVISRISQTKPSIIHITKPVRPAFAVSRGEPIVVDLPSGEQTHAFYYPPTNPDFIAPEGEKPPLLIIAHGGPTGKTTLSYNPRVQYWTSRGFAVADVNYRGSAGYGRAYREALYGEWGVADSEDVVEIANYLVKKGLADAKNLIIRGGSAGGYLVLAVMAFHKTFSYGAVYFGISDLIMMTEDTHKFEYKYLDNLIAPYPDEKALYIERSPIYHLANMDKPIIVFQGLEDKVVPPNQSEKIVEALEAKNIPVEYVEYPEEKHGFRLPENVADSLEKELAFYQKHFC